VRHGFATVENWSTNRSRSGDASCFIPLKLLWQQTVGVHVGTQSLWNQYSAVGLLIVFKDRETGAPDCQGAAGQGMDVFSLVLALRPEADIGTAGLKGLEIGAGGNFAEQLLPR